MHPEHDCYVDDTIVGSVSDAIRIIRESLDLNRQLRRGELRKA